MKYIKIYESFMQMSSPSLQELKSLIESGIKSGIKTPIYLESDGETPGLVKFLSELMEEKSQEMIIVNPDQITIAELTKSFPKQNPIDKGGIIFIEGIENSNPEAKQMIFDKILDGLIPPVWQVIIKGPSIGMDQTILNNFKRLKLK